MMMISIRFALASAIAMLACLPISKAWAEPAEKSVRMLYLVPQDRQPREDYKSAIEACVLDLQVWYYGHLSGRTFRLNDPLVEVWVTPHHADWYDSHVPSNEPEQKFYTWYNALEDAADLVGAKPDDPNYTWLIYLDAKGGTGAGVNGVAILPEHDLQGLIGLAPDQTPVSRWVGGGGHELGHGFGLPHPGEEHPEAIMQYGYVNYPACYLTSAETESLKKSPFLHAERPATFNSRGRFLYPYAGGYFLNVGNQNWEERKTGESVILKFKQSGSAGEHIQLLDASRPPGAWVALPVENGGNDILFRWEGTPTWQKIYETLE